MQSNFVGIANFIEMVVNLNFYKRGIFSRNGWEYYLSSVISFQA